MLSFYVSVDSGTAVAF